MGKILNLLLSLVSLLLKQAASSQVVTAGGHANADLTSQVVRNNLQSARCNKQSLGVNINKKSVYK